MRLLAASGPKRARLWLGTACLLLVAVLVFAARVRHEMADFEVYQVAGTRVLAAESLYRTDDGHWQFKYLPAFAVVVSPLAVLPPAASRAIWFGLSVALLVLLLNRSLALLPDRRRNGRVLVTLTVVALAKFYLHELSLGQSNLLLAVLVLAAAGVWRHGGDLAAGAWLAAATVVKPYAIVFFPYLVARRRWQAAAAYASVLVAALVVPVVHYGWSGNVALLRGWWDIVTGSTAPNLLGQDNVSIAGMFAAWVGIGGTSALLTAVTSLALVAACAVVVFRRSSATFPEYLDLSLLLVSIPLLSPQGWDYVLVVSTPAVMLLVDRFDSFGRRERAILVAALAIVGLTIWDVLGRELYRAVMMSRVITVSVLIEVWLLIRLRFRDAA